MKSASARQCHRSGYSARALRHRTDVVAWTLTTQVVVISVCIVPVYSFATWLGARLFRIGYQQHFRRASVLTLVVTGLSTLIIAVRDLLTV